MEHFSLEDFLKKHPVFADYVKEHPLRGDLSKDYPRAEVDAIQASMLQGASHFSDSELVALRVVINLTVEFFHRLKDVDIDSVDAESLKYWDGSVFSGVTFFSSLCQAYRWTEGGDQEYTSPARNVEGCAEGGVHRYVSCVRRRDEFRKTVQASHRFV
jgi:hypothetical protein